MEISNLPHEEFKVMVIKMLTKLERKVDELNRDRKYKKECIRAEEYIKMKNTVRESIAD